MDSLSKRAQIFFLKGKSYSYSFKIKILKECLNTPCKKGIKHYNVYYTKTVVLVKRTSTGGKQMEAISIGLLGLGTVGSGVVKIIENHQDKIMHQVGCPVQVKKYSSRM